MWGGFFPPHVPTYMDYIYNADGTKIKLSDISFVEKVLKEKKKSGSNPWPVIELIIKHWAESKPTEYKSFLIDVTDIRNTRKDKKYGSTKDKVTGGYLRYTLDLPNDVMYRIRKVYNVDELPMNREFFMEFSRRFPAMKVAEKM